MPEPDLTETQKAYNVASSDMFQLAAYGHHRYHPLVESLTDEGKRQERDYNNRLMAARDALEAALLRLVAEHAETYRGSITPEWLRSLADDPGFLSSLAVRPDERDFDTQPATAPCALTPCTCRQAVHAREHTNRPVDGCTWCMPAPNIRPNRTAAVTTVDAHLLSANPET